MKKIVIMMVMLITMLCASVCSADSWSDIQHNVGEDKFAHFSCSFALNHVCKQCFGMNQFWSAIATLGVGAFKEGVLDDHWDSGDMWANTAGVAVYQITW